MCPNPDSSMDVENSKKELQSTPAPSSGMSKTNIILIVVSVLAIIIVIEFASMIAVMANIDNSGSTIVINGSGGATTVSTGREDIPTEILPVLATGENICAGSNPQLPNIECIKDSLVNVNPQAGANVTQGYVGGLEVSHIPIVDDYWMNNMCPVNVHWHLGAEHYSAGEFDEFGDGPNGGETGPAAALDGGIQPGYRCNKYDANDPKFTTPYNWKHCVNMRVGETYEVHWPHSAAGACNTPNQYQTPFYDGVFCMIDKLDLATPDATAGQIGVQAQVFTIVNDESYFYPDLMRGMIKEGEYGSDVAKYTGSTTGSGRNNDDQCSQYSPITWQVDRKCQLISASTFDKMCYDMKLQRDDMTDDLYAHGSRELVSDELTANNQQRKLRA